MYLIKKLKLLTVSLVALSFLVAVSLTSCGGSASYSEDDAEAVEAVEGSADSADGDHPEGEEDGDEHPSDSTAEEGDHPEGEDSSSDSDEG